MKKLLTVLALACMLIGVSAPFSVLGTAEEHIPGFEKNMDSLWLAKSSDAEWIDEMEAFYQPYAQQRMESIMNESDWLKAKIGVVGTLEEQWKYLKNDFTLDYSKGLKFYRLHTERYLAQYVESGNFAYLINDSEHLWHIPTIGRIQGSYSFSLDETTITRTSSSIYIDEPIYEFLSDYDSIENMLKEVGETQVNSMKIVSRPLYMLLIDGEQDDYFIRLAKHLVDPPRNISFGGTVDRFKLYTITEMLEELLVVPETSPYYEGNVEGYISNTLLATKPTYDVEGEALMADGIIQGNENGLDPLKPLTRLEATTILVRALGLENEPTQTLSKFTDIPNDNWGVKYANIAADHGISKGIGDNRFDPDALVTDNQFATMVLRAAQAEDFDWQQGIPLLIERGVITQQQAETMDLFTRGDMAKIIYEARAKGLL